MKKFFCVMFISLLSLSAVITSCNKINEDNGGEKLPVVSVSAEESFNENNIAELTLTLSEATSSDVVVYLKNTDVQEGKDKISAIFEKNVTIPAGTLSKTVEIKADTYGLGDGNYQAAICVDSAEGAIVAENNVVYIDFTYSFVPTVTLYADAVFAADKTAKLRLVLSAEVSEDVVVSLADGQGSMANVSYEKSITIPAGMTEAEVLVTVEIPEDLAPGVYPAVIEMTDIENAMKGDVNSVTINLSYPFSSNISIDGSFDDWVIPNVLEWTLPEGEVLYQSIRTLKLAANETSVYLYMEFEDPGFDFNMPFNMYIDADGNPQTGAIIGNVDNDTAYPPYASDKMGLSHYLEIALHDGEKYNDFYSWGGLYKYEGQDGAGIFSGGLTSLNGTYTGEDICASGILEDGIGRIEVRLSRKFFGMTGTKARFAVKNMNGANNWSAYGLLPQGAVVDGERQLVDMAEIVLPNYVE